MTRSNFLSRTARNVAGALAGAALLSSAAAAADMSIDVQSAWPLTLPASGQNAQHFADTINEISGGALEVDLYGAGKLVPPLQIFDAVQQGTLDAGYTSPLYVAGRFPAVQLFGGVPFGPDAIDYIGWIYNGGGLEIWREIYEAQGVVTVPCGVMDAEAGGWYTFEIDSPEAMEGKKIRFAGLAGEVMKKMGASIVLLAGGDIYPNLERGVIDGTEFSMPAIDVAMGFEKVADYYYLPGWHQPAAFNELIINKRKWDSMTEAQQGQIEEVCKATNIWSLTSTAPGNAAAIAQFEEAGTEIKTFPPEVLAAFEEANDEVMAEQAEADETFARVLESLNSYRASVETWSAHKE
ncbi:Alpha-keto acid-binding periplasmic protein TakP precursor [Pseudooceanicola marinus]|uniref:Alpha-keto acid-binding periplasmic protein TakP n=1 Tax=Pseudooceanicola marinus TaxID=396013 RepID=A0A1X6ZC48_9RHOB|nr:TRAP transporter substrate-binding protein [Pseudooceanicola marinus]PJE28263.1 C4-dicarboxylate ABC transporter substrate-binding protein [Pseudooceanicola marinus]SLN47097.1 Alpha-keto acid-binding periplasmic protein TakP precursor [Pseudooceanicola marinus]